MTTYNEGVQCCRFCKRLITTEQARDHLCEGTIQQLVWFFEYRVALVKPLDDDVRDFANLLTGHRWFPRTRSCTTCGAPLADDIDVVCPYCNFTLASPEIH